ncbi:tRNA pseudouridine(38-40) synthase [Kwoniella pini CBS 10737]|uniref:tRNA pseudouridine(38-40) synthase n=1 Tax=Kwoniella pini CBS 10737 TaxID=1296096 RepID=A0A1B9HSN9_9TREE|nr:tRNA pseudouridine(38-40) synthase [Kwoniella pini CBS 10737]OCF46289.1 tRNA pseudouridine(38-40) synthase [Kwoniella pini CBS 10737]
MAHLASLSKEELIAKIQFLENAAKSKQPSSEDSIQSTEASTSMIDKDDELNRSKPILDENGKPLRKHARKAIRKNDKPFNFNSYPTRHIALMISYYGWPYCGLALQPPLPGMPNVQTVESELLKALEKTKLIEVGKGLEGCGYSRCGRTDRGVSGEGQVVNLWVRSLRTPNDGGEELPLEIGYKEPKEPINMVSKLEVDDDDDGESEESKKKLNKSKEKVDNSKISEYPYPKLLNGVLPPSIRILAWSPLKEEFDSRFSCLYRHYKYAFHLKTTPLSKPLNLELMRKASNYLIGENDHRNFCKLDGSKQINNHKRTILKAYFENEINENNEERIDENKKIIFNLIGTAFLWHQVRHIISILFLIGSELEKPEIIKDLLNVNKFPSKPLYNMGDGLPLTLHECSYEKILLDWRFSGYDGNWKNLSIEKKNELYKFAMNGRESFERNLLNLSQQAELKSWQINGSLRKLHQIYGGLNTLQKDKENQIIYPLGGGEINISHQYTKLENRHRGETPQVVNEKWRIAKGRTGLKGKKGEKENLVESVQDEDE